jgi:phage-related protein
LVPLARLIALAIQMFVRFSPLLGILRLLPGVMSLMLPVVRVVVTALAGLTNVVTNVLGWFNNLFGYIRDLPGKIAGLAGRFASAGKSIISSIFDGLKAALKSAGSFASDIASNIWKALKDFINRFLIDPIKEFHFKISIGPYHHTFEPFGSLPELAKGATVLPRDGGTMAVLAEGGRSETVVDTGLLNRQLELSARTLARLVASPVGRPHADIHVHGAPGQDVSTLSADIARRWGVLRA